MLQRLPSSTLFPYTTLFRSTLTVTNAPDTMPPSISIHSPQPLAVLAGVIQLTATASDDVGVVGVSYQVDGKQVGARSEEHTSELQSRVDLVCRLLLEKKKNT